MFTFPVVREEDAIEDGRCAVCVSKFRYASEHAAYKVLRQGWISYSPSRTMNDGGPPVPAFEGVSGESSFSVWHLEQAPAHKASAEYLDSVDGVE